MSDTTKSKPSVDGGKKAQAKGKGKKVKKGPPKPEPLPEFAEPRNALFDSLFAIQQDSYSKKTEEAIEVTLPDGSVKKGIAWKTTPLDIAKGISAGFARKQCVAEVNGKEWDLTRPIEESCTLKLHDFSSPKGQHTYWHTSAHILGEALERLYGAKLCTGPPIDQGFYYDIRLPGDATISSTELKKIEATVNKILKEKQEFKRLWTSKENCLKMFEYTKYKTELINDHVKDGEATSVYKCGPLTDLCTGPHLPHSGWVKAFHVYNTSSAYWKADAKNDLVARVYGISFADKKELKAWKIRREEAKKRDHRVLGQKQELFFFDPVSLGSCFWLPRGALIYNKLVSLMRGEYKKRGFQEVITPNIFKVDLWKTSGHWANYRDNMFQFECEEETYGLKPMNCPGHCMIFKHGTRTYKELPLRLADFGALHRNELSGTLGGLTRVRRFQQDDAHIFCTSEQIEDEIKGAFDFLKHVYGIFGFKFTMELSTRPEKFIGDIAVWNKAEDQLRVCLNKFVGEKGWKLNEGDGAFYGPKIDVHVTDAIGRSFQCATIQLDFQLPKRFKLEFDTEVAGEPGTPVMIHRAILGSVERMFAILTEHYAGKWPFWLSPRQAMVIPVGTGFSAYAEKVQKQLRAMDFEVDLDSTTKSLDKKVRNAQVKSYNYILVVGAKEQEEGGVDVRRRDEKERKFYSLSDLAQEFKTATEEYK